MIVTINENLQRATRAADAIALPGDGKLAGHGPITGMFTNPNDACTERPVSGEFG